jgi:hypothetical protein
MKLPLIAFAFVASVHAGILALAACGAAPPTPKVIVADSAYEAQQLACVDEGTTREAIDTCRARVKAAWATDGGAK